jgi:hypothetical protein
MYIAGQSNSNVTRSAVFKHSNQINNSSSNGQPVKPGLNPTMRGYSPSKLRWKQNGTIQ